VGGDRRGEGQQHDDEHDPGGGGQPAADGPGDQQGGDAEEGRFAGGVQLGVDVGQPENAVDPEGHDGQPDHDQDVGDPCGHWRTLRSTNISCMPAQLIGELPSRVR
jgi:hypothetical protein